MRSWIAGVVSAGVLGTCLWMVVSPVPGSGMAQAAQTKEFSRPAMLEDIATKVLVPGIREFHDKCQGLEKFSAKLAMEPSPENVRLVQQAWVDACLAWKRMQWIQFGPVKDRAYWSALCFKPVYPVSIEKVIRGTEPITQDSLAEQGAAAKGLYTLEYLLFDLPQGQTAWVGEDGKPARTGTPRLAAKWLLEGDQAERRRIYVREAAREMMEMLKPVRATVDDPAFIANYVKGGQTSVDLAVNGLLDELESGVVNLIRLYVDQFANRSLRYDQIEGYPSGLSVRVMEEELAGLEKLYRGGGGLGLDDYVKHVNPGLAERMEQRLKAGKEALKAFRELPVDQALVKRYAAMEKAHDELRELEIQIKLDVISSLGITLLFSSTDGD
ncbi:MAG TPA: imelysin family protein [Verrucomicrobiae bacterium]